MENFATEELLERLEAECKRAVKNDDKQKTFSEKPTSKNNTDTKYTVDEFLTHVGELGRFQIIVMIITSFLFIVPGYQAFQMVFIAASPPWVCSGSNYNECNTTLTNYEGDILFKSRCNMKRLSWKYTVPLSYSTVSEFDLVCSKESLSLLANSALFIGQVIGGLTIGWISDKYGRKKALFGSSFALYFVAFGISFSPNVFVLIAMRVISGLFHGGILVCNIVISVELVGAKYRALAGLVVWNTWAIAICFMSLQSYYIKDWRDLSKILSIPYILIILGAFFVPESVRWYHSQNKLKEAETILKRVAKINKLEYPSHASLAPPDTSNQKANGSFCDMFKTWHLTFKTLALCYMWFTNDCIYYGLSLIFSGFGGSLHRDFVLISIVDIPANLCTIYIVGKFGRKKSTIFGYMITATALLLFGILQLLDIKLLGLNIVVGIIGKVFVLLSWCGTEIWSAELYPTSIRSQAMGLFIVSSQVGAALSPWIAKGLLHFHVTLPYFILGGLPICAGIIAMTLRETNGQPIDDYIGSNDKKIYIEQDTNC